MTMYTEKEIKMFNLNRQYLLISALQKSIRWCEVNESRYFARELVNMGVPDVALSRLLLIAAEDVGLSLSQHYKLSVLSKVTMHQQKIRILNFPCIKLFFGVDDRRSFHAPPHPFPTFLKIKSKRTALTKSRDNIRSSFTGYSHD